MPESTSSQRGSSTTTPYTLNHFALFSFSDRYFDLSSLEKQAFHQELLSGFRSTAERVYLYQVYPVQAQVDFLVWSALKVEEPSSAGQFFTCFAQVTGPHRKWLKPVSSLWGFTRPSQYTKARSTQEVDPFDEERKPYLILYPFVKTMDWYLMSREARQGMMNEHIRIGKGFPEITQLLLYSFGLQDQEFIVVYETDDLKKFSDLVYTLRDTEARRFTERDTPNYTAVYHPAEQTLGLWES